VPDDKIRGRILKVRCKNCKHIFYIKDPALSEPVTENTQAPPPPEAEEQWFYALKSQSMGPVSIQTMKRLIETAQIISSTLVWKEGMDNWKPLVEVAELVAIMKATASPRPDLVQSRISEKSQEDIFDFDAQISDDRVELGEDEEQRIIRELEEEEQRTQQERKNKQRQAEEARHAAEEAEKAEKVRVAAEEAEKARREEEEARRATEEAEKARKAEEARIAAEEADKARREAAAEELHPKHLPAEKGRGLHRRSISIPAYHPTEGSEKGKAKPEVETPAKDKKLSRQIEAAPLPEIHHDEETLRRKSNEKELEDSFNHFEEQRRIQAEERINVSDLHRAAEKKAEKPVEKSAVAHERKTGFVPASEAPRRRMSVMLPAETPPPPREPEPVKKGSSKVKAIGISVVLLLVGFGAAFALGVFNKPAGDWSAKSQGDENLFLPQSGKIAQPTSAGIQQDVVGEAKQEKMQAGTAVGGSNTTAPADNGTQKPANGKPANNGGTPAVGSPAPGDSAADSQAPREEGNDDERLPMAKLDMPSEPDAASLGMPETLSQQQITSVVNRNIDRIQFCYDTQLRQNPNLSGKVVVNFTVIGEGRISSVKIMTPQFRGSYLEGCVDKTMKSWRFPKFRGDPIEVDYPFIFTSF